MTTHLLVPLFLGGAGGALIAGSMPFFGRNFDPSLLLAGIALTVAGMVS
jgi:hypothetical protein